MYSRRNLDRFTSSKVFKFRKVFCTICLYLSSTPEQRKLPFLVSWILSNWMNMNNNEISYFSDLIVDTLICFFNVYFKHLQLCSTITWHFTRSHILFSLGGYFPIKFANRRSCSGQRPVHPCFRTCVFQTVAEILSFKPMEVFGILSNFF